MARADTKGVARYLPRPATSAIAVAALSAIVTGAAVQRRRRRTATTRHPDVWATSGSTGGERRDADR